MQPVQLLQVIGLVVWIVLGSGLMVVLVLLTPALRRLSDSVVRTETLLEGIGRMSTPTLERLQQSIDNANYVTAAVRSDVERASETLLHVTEATDRIVDLAEKRVAEISGFVEVVQEEAEETFFSVAALLRGLRAGRLLVGRRKASRSSRKRRRAS